MKGTKKVGDFLKADSVVPKMVVAYNKRKQGKFPFSFLKYRHSVLLLTTT
jgi:hypothetical protein